MKPPTTAREKADEFFERMMALAAEYDVAAMKADDGLFQISIYVEHGLEDFRYKESEDPNR